MKTTGRWMHAVGTRPLALYSTLLIFMLAVTPSAMAQLSLEAADSHLVLPLRTDGSGGAAGAVSGWKSRGAGLLLPVRSGALPAVDQVGSSLLNRLYDAPAGPAKSATTATPAPFDFTRTAPHLAFFCRLEINEAAGNIIPVRFRLGGHRYWQDDLRRR